MSTSWMQQWRLPLQLPAKALREVCGNSAVAVCPSSVADNSTVSSESRSTERRQAAQPCLRPGPRAWSLSGGVECTSISQYEAMPTNPDLGGERGGLSEKGVADLDLKYDSLHVLDADDEVAWCHLMRVRADNSGSSSTSAPLLANGSRVGWTGKERAKIGGMHNNRRRQIGNLGFQESEWKGECSVGIERGGQEGSRVNGKTMASVASLVPAIADDMMLFGLAEKEVKHSDGRLDRDLAAESSSWGVDDKQAQRCLEMEEEAGGGPRTVRAEGGRHTEAGSAEVVVVSPRDSKGGNNGGGNSATPQAVAAVAYAERGNAAMASGEHEVKRKKKRVWTGAKTVRKTPPQKPWTLEFNQQKEKEIVNSIMSLEPGATVGSVLDVWLGKLTRVDLCQVMRQLSACRRLDQAMEVFQWADARTGRLRPNPHMCNLVIGLLGRSRRLAEARDLFERTLRAKFDVELSTVHVYNAMMGACVHSGEYAEAWSLLERMRSEGIVPDVVTYNTMLRACVREGLPACAMLELFERMRVEDGMAPDVRTYNTLLDGLRKERLWEQVEEILEEMRRGPASVAPDRVTYNTAITIYAKAGRPDEALREMANMRAQGIRPDLPAFTGLVEACGHAGGVREAFEVVGQMRDDGLEPDLHLWSVLVSTCGRAGLAAEAEGVVHEMRRSGCEPNIVTYGALVQAYARLAMFKDAARIFHDMQAAGITPDTRMYNILMAAYGKEGLTLHAAQLFRKMQSMGVTPDDISYNTLIRAHCQAGQVDEAAAVYKLMLKAGGRPNPMAQRQLAAAYHDIGRHQQASKLYRKSRT